jgi:hypothetical protein
MRVIYKSEFEQQLPDEIAELLKNVAVVNDYKAVIHYNPRTEMQSAIDKADSLFGNWRSVASDKNGWEYLGCV